MTIISDLIASIGGKLREAGDKLFGASVLFGTYSTDATAAADGTVVPIRTNEQGEVVVTSASGSSTTVAQGDPTATPATKAWFVKAVDAAGTLLGAAASPLAVRLSNGAAFVGAALDATLTAGLQKAIVRGGAKGSTTAADVTSMNVSADRQALDVTEQLPPDYERPGYAGAIEVPDGEPTDLWAQYTSPQLDNSAAASAAGAFRTSATNLRRVHVVNGSATTLYLRFVDSAATPTTGASKPCRFAPIAMRAGESAYVDMPGKGARFAAGCAFYVSTVPETNTAPGAPDLAKAGFTAWYTT